MSKNTHHHNHDNNLNEPLLGDHSKGNFKFSTEELCELFHPDNIKNYHNGNDGGKVSIALHKLWAEFGGTSGLASGLKSDTKVGIEGNEKDLEERIHRYGGNKKRMPKIRTLFELIMENFEDRILQILLMAAALALIIGIVQHGWKQGWVEGTSIFFAVTIIVSVTAGNNYVKEKQFQKLVSKASEEYIAVYRGGEGMTQTILNNDLVVGDVIKIEAGMRIPADCVLIEGTDIATDESAMTGEPEQVEKASVNQQNYIHNPNPFLIGKTLVESGQGLAIICAVGVHTRSGMAEEKLNIEDEITPLQAKLETIANEIGKVGVYVAILTFVAMSINLSITIYLDANRQFATVETLNKFIDFIIIAVTVIVVAVPEGLPLAVTISLAFSVMKMKKENNLVRKLDASETMGGANEICTDKTGTLTKNLMSVKEFYTCDQVHVGRPGNFAQLKSSQVLTEGVLFNCSARIEKDDKGKYIPKGNCTEQGLINFLMEVGVRAYDVIREKENNILQQIPFNSMRKRACTVVRDPKDSNKIKVFTKGAPEIVIDYCDKYFNTQGEAVQLTPEAKQKILKEIVTNTFAKKAYRTLLIAYSELSKDEYERLRAANNNFHSEKDREVLENNLTVVGIYALQDPLRDEIVESVKKCKRAGINIRMVTGDNIDTAKAIAVEAGIVSLAEVDNQYVCMEGKQFRELCGGLKKLEDPSNRGLIREDIFKYYNVYYKKSETRNNSEKLFKGCLILNIQIWNYLTIKDNTNPPTIIVILFRFMTRVSQMIVDNQFSNSKMEVSGLGNDIQSCEHNEYVVFCQNHEKILCLDCALNDHQNCGGQKAKTLKVAATEQVQKFEDILQVCKEHQNQCALMQQRVANQVGLEDEILQKVDQQYNNLKSIIDEQKESAKNIIRNLESVQNYKPPPQNFTVQTIDNLNSFSNDVDRNINQMKSFIQQSKYLEILKQRKTVDDFQNQLSSLKQKILQHNSFFQENSRPNIQVKSEVDKFRGFLHDVISFEPDYILAPMRPRLHYFDEDSRKLYIHELQSQTTECIQIRNADKLPTEFSSIQAQNKIFIIGGEKKDNDIRCIYSNDTFVVNEQTYDVVPKAQMRYARSGHQLAHLHRKFDYQTKDYIYAIGSKYPDETGKKCEVYDISKNKWTEIGDLQQSRHYHSVTVLENRYLYVIGGRDSLTESPLDSIERLDGFASLENQKWETIQVINKEMQWTPRDTLGSFALSDTEILIFGGDYGWISDCFVFSTKSMEIQKSDCTLKKPEEFFRSQAVKYNDKVFVVGNLDKDVHVYSLKAQKWFLLDKWFIDW